MVCASLSQTNARPYALSMLFALMLICVVIGTVLMMMMIHMHSQESWGFKMNRNLCNYCGFLVQYPVLGRRPRGCPCQQAPYCDALCQRRNWRRHKSLCLWYCLMFKVQEVVEFPEEIVFHICKFAADSAWEKEDCEVPSPSQRGRKKRKGTFNLSVH